MMFNFPSQIVIRCSNSHKPIHPISGKFRGRAHNACNLPYGIDPRRWKIPVLFHNLKGYDGHYVINAAKPEHGNIRVIPTNMERFLAFSVGRLQFLDSFQFASESLDSLVKSVPDEDLVYTREAYPDEQQFKDMRVKGIFPYDMITSLEMITSTEAIEFPSKDDFYNKLYDTPVDDAQWERAKRMFEKYCPNKTLGEYHDLYLHADVLLLADFFEKYRKMCLAHYGVDPLHYFSAPGMAWDSALKMTGVELELITSEDQYLFVEVRNITHWDSLL